MRLRLPKSARLTQAAEFARVRRDGRAFHGRWFMLTVLRVEAVQPSRFGLVTSRRVGSAVVRNRVRRRLREIVRLDRPRLAAGCWFTIVARSAAAQAKTEVLRAEWRRLAMDAGLLALEG
jgi:ribonuclease P protein component